MQPCCSLGCHKTHRSVYYGCLPFSVGLLQAHVVTVMSSRLWSWRYSYIENYVSGKYIQMYQYNYLTSHTVSYNTLLQNRASSLSGRQVPDLIQCVQPPRLCFRVELKASNQAFPCLCRDTNPVGWRFKMLHKTIILETFFNTNYIPHINTFVSIVTKHSQVRLH